MADELQRLALVRSLAPRIATLELDAVRLVDHVVTRLELGRERYGDLDLAAPRDWSRELVEEQVDAVIYAAARELAAQDREREQLREAARVEMVGPAFRAAAEQHAEHDVVAGRYAALCTEVGEALAAQRIAYIANAVRAGSIAPDVARFAELFNRECDAAIAAANRREAELDAHGYGGPADGIHVRVRGVANYVAPAWQGVIGDVDEPELGGEG